MFPPGAFPPGGFPGMPPFGAPPFGVPPFGMPPFGMMPFGPGAGPMGFGASLLDDSKFYYSEVCLHMFYLPLLFELIKLNFN
jgi:hypothetical protein